MAHTHYRTKGVVLGGENRGEADQLFTVFTEDFGKIEVLGRAIRKMKSKLRASIDLFYYSEIEFICGKSYKILTDAILIEKFSTSPETFEALSQFTRAALVLIPKEHKDDKIWQLLLQSGLTRGPTSGYLSLFWRLCDILGYKPELYNCACCHAKLLPEKLFFSPEHGGVICKQCKIQDEYCQEILIDTIKVLRLFLEEPFVDVGKIKTSPAVLNNLRQISKLYLQHLTENHA